MEFDFGGPDPSIALPQAPDAVQRIPGPLHKLEFVVELVGPRSVNASQAASLLSPQWYNALGQPNLWAMSPSDSAWRPLTNSQNGSYDSLALSWPYVGTDGNLSSASAAQLVATAEQFAGQIQRRAMAIPPPQDVDHAVRTVLAARESLDIGMSVGVVFGVPQIESEVWRVCVGLGLTYDNAGGFLWGSLDTPSLTVSPLDPGHDFALSGVQAMRPLSGVSIGFNLPCSPDPLRSLEAAQRVAETFQSRFGGLLIDDEGDAISSGTWGTFAQAAGQAIQSLASVGIVPGSTEALTLFGS